MDKATIDHMMSVEAKNEDRVILWPISFDYYLACEHSAYVLTLYFPYVDCFLQEIEGQYYAFAKIKISLHHSFENTEYVISDIRKNLNFVNINNFLSWKMSLKK